MGRNLIEDISFGAQGSAYSVGASLTAPTGCVFVAIQMLENTTFTTLTPATGSSSVGSASTGTGTGGVVIPNTQVFPKGTTLYGRYSVVDVNSGKIIAYVAS